MLTLSSAAKYIVIGIVKPSAPVVLVFATLGANGKSTEKCPSGSANLIQDFALAGDAKTIAATIKSPILRIVYPPSPIKTLLRYLEPV